MNLDGELSSGKEREEVGVFQTKIEPAIMIYFQIPIVIAEMTVRIAGYDSAMIMNH